jgi:hypothetical protein
MEPMPETKTESSRAAKAQHPAPKARRASAGTKSAVRKPSAAGGEHAAGRAVRQKTVERSTEPSGSRLSSIDDGAQSAIEALRKFGEKVDRSRADSASMRQEITDSALQAAQRLVHTQSDFLRKLVDNASRR